MFYLLKSVCEWDVLPSKKALLKEHSREGGGIELKRELKQELKRELKGELKGGGATSILS